MSLLFTFFFSDLNSHCSLSLGTLCLLYLSSGPPPMTRSQKGKQSLPPSLHMSLLPFLHPSQKLWTSQNNAIAKENTAMRRCHSNGRWQRLLAHSTWELSRGTIFTYTHSQASLRIKYTVSTAPVIPFRGKNHRKPHINPKRETVSNVNITNKLCLCWNCLCVYYERSEIRNVAIWKWINDENSDL